MKEKNNIFLSLFSMHIEWESLCIYSLLSCLIHFISRIFTLASKKIHPKHHLRLYENHTQKEHLNSIYYVSGTVLNSLHVLTNSLLPSTQWGRNFYCLQLIGEATKKQGQVACPGQKAEKWQSHNYSLNPKSLITNCSHSFAWI